MTAPPGDVADALAAIGVDPDRLSRLEAYVAALDRWRQRINLVGPTDVDGLWRRHVLDSAQLWPLLDDPSRPLIDLGTGAGLPGLVLAILGAADATLVDSDQRKAVFLREAARAAGASPRIVAKRFDAALAAEGQRFGVVTSRAAAPLPRLAPVLAAALAPGGYALLHKGAQAEKELTEARKSWRMQIAEVPSITGSGGVILKIWGLERHA